MTRSKEAKFDEKYYQASLNKPLHDIYRILEPHLKPPGLAVDIGCGVGAASLFLAKLGFRVIALDQQRRALEILASRIEDGMAIELVEADMLEFELPAADVIVSGFSLFFLDQAGLAAYWPKVVAALVPGGLFAGQFLGPHDEWASQGHALVDRETLEAMLSPFELLHFEEVDREGFTSVGDAKHWHVFHVVARKK